MPGQESSGWQRYQQSKQTTQSIIDELMVFIKFLRAMFYLVLWVATIPAEVCLHTRFGVRYLNLFTIIGGVASLVGLLALAGPDAAPWGGMAILGFLALAIGHRVHAHLLEQKGVLWHSRSSGQPFKFWDLVPGERTPFDVESFLEPALVIGVGMLLGSANRIGLVVIGVGIMLFIKKWLEFWHFKGMVLDQIDGQIEAEVLAEWVDQKRSPKETKGYTVPKAAVRRAKTGLSVAEAMAAVKGDGDAAPGTGLEVKVTEAGRHEIHGLMTPECRTAAANSWKADHRALYRARSLRAGRDDAVH